jgi:putative acetyltransferase
VYPDRRGLAVAPNVGRLGWGQNGTIPERHVIVPTMMLVVRKMRDDDARSFLKVQYAAVRRIAVRDYPPEVIEAWGPLPITQAAVEAIIANPEDEIRFLAERDGDIVGLACLVIANNKLRACYVAPEAARTGVGKALLMKIEETARNAGVKYLHAVSSSEPRVRGH